jgi:hypothetical protein
MEVELGKVELMKREHLSEVVGKVLHLPSERVLVACLGNPDPVGMKVYCPTRKETFDDETTKEASPRRDRGEAA